MKREIDRMSYSLDDTQPRSPLKDAALKPTIRMDEHDPDEPPVSTGPGCGMIGLISVILVVFAVLIVALAGAAGWTAGQREGETILRSTRDGAIREQVDRIPADVASGNVVLLRTRLEWLATAAPDYADLPNLALTGTAVYFNSFPTPTPTLPPTVAATQAAPIQQVIATPARGGGFDIDAIYAQAQVAMNGALWEDAIELLDVVVGLDSNYESGDVRRLLNQALQNRALELYNADQPAAANILVGRAEEYGQIDSSLDYERYAAELFLEARAAVGIGSPVAVQSLQEVLSLGAGGRYYDESRQLLYNQYVLIGDSYMAQSNYCGAAGQYQFAMNVFGSGTANGKYANAQNLCVNAVPTVDPNWMLTPGAVAPVGVVQPPGQP